MLELGAKRRKSDASDEASRFDPEVLAAQALPNARACAVRFANNSNGRYNVDDLFSAALEGIKYAIDRFNPAINPNFPGYADKIIRQHIIKEARRLVWGFGLQSRPRMVHLDAPIGDDGESLGQYVGDPRVIDPFEFVARLLRDNLFKEEVAREIGKLGYKEQLIIQMMFFEDRNIAEVARELGWNVNTAKSVLRRSVNEVLVSRLAHLQKEI